MTSVAAPLEQGHARGDSEAERLYAEYSDRILAYCLGRLGSRSEAEDAVQMTFLYALRALRRGDDPESESAWLYTIAKNVCRWQRRTASRRPLSGERGLESVAAAERDDDDERELLSGLRGALQSLPERQRHALVLREWRGLSAHEIADQLGLSAPATHALLTRARRSLALALTAPQRAALGLASLVYELRSWFKAALGGASAKAAVATIAVVGVGMGSVAVDQSLGKERSTPPGKSSERAVEVVDPAVAASRTTRDPTAAATRTAASPQAGQGASSRLRTAALDRERRAFASPRRPSEPAAGERAAGPDSPPASAASESGAPVTVPLQVPAPLEAGLPPVDVPPVDLPPLDLPVELPPVELPPVELPPVDLPPVDLPTDVLPPVDLPAADLPSADLPPVDVPPVDVPPVDVPPLPLVP